MTGLRAVMGSWKIMAMRRPRRDCKIGGAGAGEVASLEEHRAGEPRLRRQQSHDGQGGDAFAGAGFTDQGEGFAGGERERDLAHGSEGPRAEGNSTVRFSSSRSTRGIETQMGWGGLFLFRTFAKRGRMCATCGIQSANRRW